MARILLVEDDPMQLDMRKQIIELAGHEVITAQDASEALERLDGCGIVVTDLRIPSADDGARLIRSIEGRARIIVLTGGQIDPDLQVDEVLTKPCPSKRLLESIAKWTTSGSK